MPEDNPITPLINAVVDLRSRRDDLTDTQIANKLNADDYLRQLAPNGKWTEKGVRQWAKTYRVYRRPGPKSS